MLSILMRESLAGCLVRRLLLQLMAESYQLDYISVSTANRQVKQRLDHARNASIHLPTECAADTFVRQRLPRVNTAARFVECVVLFPSTPSTGRLSHGGLGALQLMSQNSLGPLLKHTLCPPCCLFRPDHQCDTFRVNICRTKNCKNDGSNVQIVKRLNMQASYQTTRQTFSH